MNFDLTTQRIAKVQSDIRGPLYEEALRMESEGKKVLKLNTGNPAAFGFSLPESVKEALFSGVEKASAYCDVKGMKMAREAILAYHKKNGIQNTSIEDIFLSNGVSEMVQMLALATLNPGDEILLPSPNYALWKNCTYLADAMPVFYLLNEENNWQPDLEDMAAKITDRTKAILLINPNNPTGAVFGKEVLEGVVELARRHNLMIFSDEIYDRLVMDGLEVISTASLAPDLLCVTLNGLSKSHIICGFRCGWGILSGPEEKKRPLRDGLTKLAAMRLCSGALPQLAVSAALSDSRFTDSMLIPKGRLFDQREAVCSVLETIDGISFVKNRAAFYLFPKLDKEKFGITDDKKFALDLLRAKNILVIPGSGFDHGGNDHFRIVMLPDKDILKKAMLDLGDFLIDYKQR